MYLKLGPNAFEVNDIYICYVNKGYPKYKLMPNARKFPWGSTLINDNHTFEKLKYFNNLGRDFIT